MFFEPNQVRWHSITRFAKDFLKFYRDLGIIPAKGGLKIWVTPWIGE
jgi:hypothetical protein